MFLFKNLSCQNLISNGSFESFTNPIDCAGGGFDNNGVGFPSPHVLDNWYNFNSPDYFNGVCNAGGYHVPYSYFGNCHAKHGNAFVGMYLYKNGSENKEYIYQELNTPLEAGKFYCLSFYVSRVDRIPFAVKNLGAYFSNSLPTLIGFEYISAIPQVEHQNSFLTDTVGWTKIEGCFIAQGGEQYMTIGNFHNNANTDTLRIQSTNPLTGTGTDVAYYYIDDITLTEDLGTGIKEKDNLYGITVYPNPASDVLNIDLSQFITRDKLQIKITDIIGKEVLQAEFKPQINLSGLARGVYFVSMEQDGKALATRKFIKE